jgi:hypothetical protein
MKTPTGWVADGSHGPVEASSPPRSAPAEKNADVYGEGGGVDQELELELLEVGSS